MELQFDVSKENKEQKDVVLAPSEPNIEIRTMKSDIQALKEGGGDLANIPVEENAAPAIPRPTVSDKPIFTSEQEIDKNSLPIVKIVIIIISVLILASGIGFVSYYLASEVFK